MGTGSTFSKLYSEIEAAKALRLGTFVVESFAYEFFLARNRQTRADFRDLWKYSDTMHENRLDLSIHNGLDERLSREQFDVFCDVARRAYAANGLIGAKNCGRDALTRAAGTFKVLEYLIEELGLDSVFEIGPGSGHLGALLGTRGVRYTGYEVTQAFYAYQHHLWSCLFPDSFHDLAAAELSSDHGTVLHIPWWVFADFRKPIPSAGIVVANHVFREMTEWARKFTIVRLAEIVEPNGLLLVEGWGAGSPELKAQIIDDLKQRGFQLVHNGPMPGISRFHYSVFSRQRVELPWAREPLATSQSVNGEEIRAFLDTFDESDPGKITNAQFFSYAEIDH